MLLKNTILLLLTIPSFMSCNSSVTKLFDGKKTPHEKYAASIDKDPTGKQWVDLSSTILATPQPVQLPYRQLGYFPAGKPRALALQFTAKRGEHISFDLLEMNNTGLIVYADIYKQNGTGMEHLVAAETDDTNFGFDAEETGEYILRLQPELQQSGQYDLSITTSPSLGFPVAGKARVGSVWGDSRDGGERSHEGIDIFAPKLTPAIAAADGYITRVRDGGLGGKTISLKPSGRDLSLYYAHLDTQLVEEGQFVHKGDTIGLVGNTGNAKATSPHLHFGIYTYGGAIDPLPFVNREVKKIPAPVVKKINGTLQLTKQLKYNTATIPANTVLIPLAVNSKNYLVELPDGTIIAAPLQSVKFN